jgi:hypothetical protein
MNLATAALQRSSQSAPDKVFASAVAYTKVSFIEADVKIE